MRNSICVFLSILGAAALAVPTAAQVTPNDVRYSAERIRTQQDSYRQAGGDLAPIQALAAEAAKLAPTDRTAAYRTNTHGIVIEYGGQWNAESELTTALDFDLAAKVVGPGDPLRTRAQFLFDAPAAAAPPYRLELAILDHAGKQQAAVPGGIALGDVRGRREGETIGLVFDPSKLVGPGTYTLRATLKNGTGAQLFQYYRSFVLVPDLGKRVAELERTLELLPDQKSSAATTARFVLDSVQQARQSYLSGALAEIAGYLHTLFRPEAGYPEVMDFDGELRFAAGLADGLEQGRNPLDGAKGNLHLAYRSSFDGKLMPYRVFVPANYDPSRAYPLAVLLHGSGGDENTFLGGGGGFAEIAAARGYILAAPNGRGPVSGYAKENGAQQDVMDVVALVQKSYHIDPDRVYLTGHSMGGMGTWTIGLAYRDHFAALAPMAGSRDSAALDQALSAGAKIPVLVTCGGKDPLMPAAGCKVVADKAKELGYPIEYVVYPNDNHWMVVASAVHAVFDFFDAHRKTAGN